VGTDLAHPSERLARPGQQERLVVEAEDGARARMQRTTASASLAESNGTTCTLCPRAAAPALTMVRLRAHVVREVQVLPGQQPRCP
jgi:hypothetical protein